ncbi:MAG: sulfatase [Gloeobacteraceae cyanobacterium ES-bin-144]|nr:sulfatase [Verrucomicrobiales bacterium]
MMKTFCFFLLGLMSGSSLMAVTQARPNILWMIGDDLGTELGCYGNPDVHTPHLDRLAAEGVRYTHFYTTAPVCSSSRSAFMTGMYAQAIHAGDHPTAEADKQPLPTGVRLLSHRFRDVGYVTSNLVEFPAAVGFNGTGKTHWNFSYDGEAFDTKCWADLLGGKPFFAQINFTEPHRLFRAPHRLDPAKVTLPPFYPDHPVVRADWAAYLDDVGQLDRKAGAVLAQLKTDGLEDNTIVVFFSDNGRCHIRDKQFCYEEGLHVPLIIRWPKNFPAPAGFTPGRVDDRLLAAIDLAPTMLAAAGAPMPPAMQGRAFQFGPYVIGFHPVFVNF